MKLKVRPFIKKNLTIIPKNSLTLIKLAYKNPPADTEPPGETMISPQNRERDQFCAGGSRQSSQARKNHEKHPVWK